jgi:hypothetical protein
LIGKRKAVKQCRAWADETRTLAYEHARNLALGIVGGELRSPPIYELGVVLDEGEQVLRRSPAVYWWRSKDTWVRTAGRGVGQP